MSRWLMHVYPRAWRERYGDELTSLIEADSGGRRIALRVKLDVIGAGLVQRLRYSGLSGDEMPPEGRIRAGVLLVLSSWAAFVVAGLVFAKTAEHWQALAPRPDRGTAAAAYDAVLIAAVLGTLLVLLGIALVARPFYAFLRAGGWQMIHRPVVRALGSTGLTVVVLVAVVVWAHQLTDAERNGGSRLYGVAFVALAACAVVSIALWTYAAVATAGRLALTRASWRRETFLAALTTVTMIVMTVAATIWWASVYAALPARMVELTFVMLGATALAAAGTAQSVRAFRG